MYECRICKFKSGIKSVVTAHVFNCLTSLKGNVDVNEREANGNDQDHFFNFKNGEFFIDSLILISLNFERYGNGLGMYIISKVMLPFMHKLGHSNYSNTIHRFICRVISCSTPQEGLKMIHERFANRRGKSGGNIFKDRRVEYRIRVD